MCATDATVTIDANFPCDTIQTDETEACVIPVAFAQAPEKISSCPGTPISVDGSRSTGGGIKPLTYQWSAHPTKSDNFFQIQPALQSQMSTSGGAADKVSLSNELDGGRTYVIVLRVVNFLGVSSEAVEVTILRDALAIPTIIIAAPPLLTFRATDTVILQASAQLASCFEASALKIDFFWLNTFTVVLPDAPAGSMVSAIDLDSKTRVMRDLNVRGSSMLPGLRYTMQVRGCMASDASVCGYASTNISLIDQPLRSQIAGGDRAVGEDNEISLDASSSADPDDLAALLHFVWTCTELRADETSALTQQINLLHLRLLQTVDCYLHRIWIVHGSSLLGRSQQDRHMSFE